MLIHQGGLGKARRGQGQSTVNVLVLDRRNDMASSKTCGRVTRVGTAEEKFVSEGKEVKGLMSNGVYFSKC